MRALRHLLVAFALLTPGGGGRGGVGVAHARTFPTEVNKLLALKEELERRGLGYLLSTWRCPSEGECDPCGPDAGASDSWGAWHYIACRHLPEAERAEEAAKPRNRAVVSARAASRENAQYFAVTNIHLSDLNIEGTLASLDALCRFRHLRELDLDGGRLRGPIPSWLGECFPHLTELDLSHNRLEGDVPRDPWRGMPKLQQVKLEDNRLTGAVPPEFASLADLRVLWLEDNNFAGPIPAAFGARNALRRIISVNFEDNPGVCGDVPEGLVVDWRWHLENQAGQSRDWLAFCEKDPCGVFAYGGTGVGRPCQSGEAAAAAAAAAACGKAWEQCGGTVALRLTGDADWSADATADVFADVPFDGPQCCRRGSTCEDVPREEPCASGGDECSFRRCVPSSDPGARPAPATEVPADVLAAYRAANRANDPDDDPDAAPCAPHWGQCGGTAAWIGPSCCSGDAPCVRASDYFSRCDPTDCAGPWARCGGAGHDGPTCCREGECVIREEGYHECVPAATLDATRARGVKYRRVDSRKAKIRVDETTVSRPSTTSTGTGTIGSEASWCAADRERCGGGGFETPGRCCGASSRCARLGDAWWACEPCAETFGQCGGADWTGGRCCASDDDVCVAVDAYYSQCRPTMRRRVSP